jgi:hypothetical protein
MTMLIRDHWTYLGGGMVHEIGCGKGRGATWREGGVQGVCTYVNMVTGKSVALLWRGAIRTWSPPSPSGTTGGGG